MDGTPQICEACLERSVAEGEGERLNSEDASRRSLFSLLVKHRVSST